MTRPSRRPSRRAGSPPHLPAETSPNNNDSLPPHQSYVTRRATAVHIVELAEQLHPRDLVLLGDLRELRCLTGIQLERLHFHDLAATNRKRARSRVLSRLIRLETVTTLDRRIGGVRKGSDGLIYALDIAGRRVVRHLTGPDENTVRRPWTPGLPFLAHTLAVSELYVRLREAERAGQLELADFRAEPASWHRTVTIGTIKPDAYVLLSGRRNEDAWWVEVDMATESKPTLRRKLSLYLLAVQVGISGPHDVLPRVLVTVPDQRRLEVVREIVADLGSPAERWICPCLHAEAIPFMADVLQE